MSIMLNADASSHSETMACHGTYSYVDQHSIALLILLHLLWAISSHTSFKIALQCSAVPGTMARISSTVNLPGKLAPEHSQLTALIKVIEHLLSFRAAAVAL